MTINIKYSVSVALCAFAAYSFTSTSNPTETTNSSNNSKLVEIRKNNEPVKFVVADFTEVAKQAIPAVVSIKVQSKRKPSFFNEENQGFDPYDLFGGNDLWKYFNLPKQDSSKTPQIIGQASGVIVSADGYILTNSHVVHDMDSILVSMQDGRELEGKVLGDDPNTDLALVKIEAKDLPFLKLGNSDSIEVGQWVAAVGNPFGMQATMTAGIISAKNRSNLDIAHYEDFIQTDAAINRGNSGGPLISLDGEIIGINTAIATNASAGYMGIGFAIPSNVAQHIMEEILSDGKVTHGFLGISLQSIDYNLAQAFNLKKVGGALVTSVVKDSPADKAGIQVEDIVLKVDEKPVNSAAVLRNAVYIMKPGTKIQLTILRKDQTIQIPATVTDFKDTTVASSMPQKTQLGIEVDNLTPEMARTYGYTNEQGVVITKVAPNSVASLAGLKKGTLISSVNRQKTDNVIQFNEALKNAPKERPILFQIIQGGQNYFLSLKSE
jgi:serine protease Do